MSEIIDLWDRLAREGKVIKGAPISFSIVCIASFLICCGLFGSDLAMKSETIQSYKDRLDSINSTVKSSPSQSVQTVIYARDPNAEKLTPPMTNDPALAYTDDGKGPIFTWSVKFQCWK